MTDRSTKKWTIYAAEAVGLGAFMISACVFSMVLFHPESPVSAAPRWAKLAAMGAAMGLTAIAIFVSRLGKLSGAHINPAVTLTFLRLGKIGPGDALFYVLFQFIGAVAGVGAVYLIAGAPLADAQVNFAVTVPGSSGAAVAFAAEFAISFLMMAAVLTCSGNRRRARFTPLVAGVLVGLFIVFESPVSGMSMNPARTFGSAVIAGVWTDWWLYFLAPPLAMLAAGEIFRRTSDRRLSDASRGDALKNKRSLSPTG